MKIKHTILTVAVILSGLLLSACGKKEETKEYVGKSAQDSSVKALESTDVKPPSADQQNITPYVNNDSWIHVAVIGNTNGITNNHIYVSPQSRSNNSILVKTRLEYGNLSGWSLVYRKEIDCQQNALRTTSYVNWYNPSGALAKQAPPTNPNWKTAKDNGDQAVINYICR